MSQITYTINPPFGDVTHVSEAGFVEAIRRDWNTFKDDPTMLGRVQVSSNAYDKITGLHLVTHLYGADIKDIAIKPDTNFTQEEGGVA